MKKKGMTLFVLVISLALCLWAPALAENAPAGDTKELRLLFTSDMHSYFMPDRMEIDGRVREHGGAARLKTLLDAYRDENTLYLDCGDFSMGTLLQAGYSDKAYEMRILSALGCDAVSLGNHELDYGAEGLASMLNAAKASEGVLPSVLQSNLSFQGELSPARSIIKDKFEEGVISEAVHFDVGGLNVTVFGLMGIDAAELTPSGGQEWIDYKKAAQAAVDKYRKSCDVLICLSHSGMEGGKKGEDVDLAGEIKGIDVIISGHSHTTLKEARMVGDTIIGACGEYLSYLGLMDLTISGGAVSLADYRLIPCDENVEEDAAMAAMVEGFKEEISQSYLADYGYSYDEPIAYSGFDFISLKEMYATHQEYNMGDLIADSYIHEAKAHGIDDIDVAIVGLGTIRGSIMEGYLSAADAFKICSLGVGSDGSAGHALISAYITGKELKLLTELDASFGPSLSSIKMSYSGLSYRFNTSRILLDRVTHVGLERGGGYLELIEDDGLYKVCCNMYAANMLGMVNGLTKGILSIVPKDESGAPIDDFENAVLRREDGKEIKEWIALANYLKSFRKGQSTLPEVPEFYSEPLQRKVAYAEGGLARISSPGFATWAVLVLGAVIIIAALAVIILLRRKYVRKKTGKKG